MRFFARFLFSHSSWLFVHRKGEALEVFVKFYLFWLRVCYFLSEVGARLSRRLVVSHAGALGGFGLSRDTLDHLQLLGGLMSLRGAKRLQCGHLYLA